MLNDDANAVADDITSPHAPLLEHREGIITRPKSVPKFYVLRLLVIYGIFEFHYHLLQSALFILPLVSSPHAPENRYSPPSLHLCLYIIAVTLTAGLWLRLASPSAWGPKRIMMISIAGMFIFAIAVLIYLRYFITSYTATCIVHLLNGLLGGNLVFGALVYAQLAEVITRPLSRFAIFSFVLGLDFLLTSSTDMVVSSWIGFTLNEVLAWIVCLVLPVVHIVLVHVLLPSRTCLYVDHPGKPADKAVATPLAALMTPKRLLVLSTALIIYMITQSPSPVKGMAVLANHRVEAPSFILLFFTIQQIQFTVHVQ